MSAPLSTSFLRILGKAGLHIPPDILHRRRHPCNPFIDVDGIRAKWLDFIFYIPFKAVNRGQHPNNAKNADVNTK